METTTESEKTVLGMVTLDSNLLRSPQIFNQYGPSIEGLARDLMIWAAWNGAKQAQLNVRQFAKMFGYSTAFLFKRLEPQQQAELKQSKMGPEFKDRIGYALAKLYLQRLNFPAEAPFVAKDDKGIERKYAGLMMIKGLTSKTSRLGTYYSFELSGSVLNNCRNRYQGFNLDTYLALRDTSGKAYSSGRKMYLHLCWKRKVWDKSKKQAGVYPSNCQYDELVSIAGFERNDPRRTAHALRQLLEDVATLPGVGMSADVALDYQTEQYSVTMRRHATLTK